MNQYKFLFSFLLLSFYTNVIAQPRVLTECVVNYSMEAFLPNSNTTEKSEKTITIKGHHGRLDVLNSAYALSIIYNKNNGSVVVLREIKGSKYMSQLSTQKWISEQKKYDSLSIQYLEETKTILGYACKKARILLKNNSQITLYYCPNLLPFISEMDYQFKDIQGLVLEYSIKEANGYTLSCMATAINFNPVLLTKFEIPNAGYRLLD